MVTAPVGGVYGPSVHLPRSRPVSASRRLRSLPLRVAPIPGEALDSWLDALALRHGVARRALLERCAIAHSGYGAWMRRLEMVDFTRLAELTGCDPAAVAAMASPRCGDTESSLRATETLPSGAWGWQAHSRWCPQCLTDTGGRWLLAWRLNWTFACLNHNRLLEDLCPTCAASQRRRPPGTRLPLLGRCTEPVRAAPEKQACCGADLDQVREHVEPVTASTMRSQRLMNAVLAGRRVPLRVYGLSRLEPQEMLSDVTTMVRYVSALVGDVASGTSLPPALADQCDLGRLRGGNRANSVAKPTALSIATATTITMAIMDAPTASSGERMLADLILTTIRGDTHRIYSKVALTPPIHRICERAQDRVRAALTHQRRFYAAAAKTSHSTSKSRRARAVARMDSRSFASGTHCGR